MALMQAARNYGAEQIAKNKLKFVSLWQGRQEGGVTTADKPTANTAIAASKIEMTGSEAKGYTNGKLVWIKALTASVTGLVVERGYYVVEAGVNGFSLAEKEGGTAVKVAGHILETGTELILLSEEVAVARIATTFAAGASDASEDATTRKIKVKAGKKATFAVFYEVETLGTGEAMSVAKLTAEEPFTEEGEYNLTSDKLEGPYSLA